MLQILPYFISPGLMISDPLLTQQLIWNYILLSLTVTPTFYLSKHLNFNGNRKN